MFHDLHAGASSAETVLSQTASYIHRLLLSEYRLSLDLVSIELLKNVTESLDLVCDEKELLDYIVKQGGTARWVKPWDQQTLRDHLASKVFPDSVEELPLPVFQGAASSTRILAFVAKFCLIFNLCTHERGNLALDVDWGLSK